MSTSLEIMSDFKIANKRLSYYVLKNINQPEFKGTKITLFSALICPSLLNTILARFEMFKHNKPLYFLTSFGAYLGSLYSFYYYANKEIIF